MHAAFFAPYAGLRPHFETELDLIQRHLDAGDHVTVYACPGGEGACDANPRGEAYRCVRCRGRRSAGMGLLDGQLRETPFELLTRAQRDELAVWRPDPVTHDQLTRLEIDNFDIGWAVLSSLVSLHRDPAVDLVALRPQRDGLLRMAWRVYHSLRNRLRAEGVDRLYVWNGRHAPLRAAMRAAQAEGVPCLLHERGHSPRHYELYRDAMPHDRAYITRQIGAAWDEAGPGSDRERVGARWFERRAAGAQQSWQSFVTGQQQGRMPQDWDDRRRNIAVFPSSEDEFVAIGREWRNPLFDSQLAGLRWLLAELDRASGGLHLTLRVHPNLAGVDNEQTRGLAALTSPHLTVIAAEDPVCTYTLLRRAEKVLTFGSTIGIEAVYWGKPSVLAGMAYYRDLGATANPPTPADLPAALDADLPAAPREPALRYGYYQATFGKPFRYFEASSLTRGTFKRRSVRPTWRSQAYAQLVKRLAPRRRPRQGEAA